MVMLTAGCGVALDASNPPVSTTLTVFNRTLEPVTFIDATGRRLPVAACDQAVAREFRIEMVEIRADGGLVGGWGGGGGGAARPQFFVLTADLQQSAPHSEPPERPLPPCEGRPPTQDEGGSLPSAAGPASVA